MLQRYQNKLSMWRAVLKILDQNRGAWSGKRAIEEAVKQLKACISEMENAGTIQQTDTTGLTEDKYVSEDQAIALVLDIAGAARAYAIDLENHDFYVQMDITKRSLEKLPDNALRDKLQSMMNAISNYSTSLADYDVTAEEIKAAMLAVDSYRPMIAAPRTAITTRKTATESIPHIIRRANKILDKLDGLIRRLRTDHATVVSDYRNARIVVDAGIRHDAPGQPAQ